MCFSFFQSSIGKKMVMAVTGLCLLGFVIVHMLGNMQVFLGPDWLNSYAEHLQNLPLLLWPARVILLIIFLLHVWTAIALAVENRKARPVAYIQKGTVQASHASVTMVLSGIIIFVFLLYHLLHFTFGAAHPEFFHLTDAKGRHDVYSMVVLSFQNYFIAGAYVFSMGILGMHLSHGAPRFFQSLGLSNEKTLRKMEIAGKILAWTLAIGNASIPVSIVLRLVKLPGGGL